MDKQATIKFFDSIAPKWDEMENPKYTKRIASHFKKIKVKPDEKILDAACGTGILEPYLKEADTLFLDISKNMLLELLKKYPAAKTLRSSFESAKLPKNYFNKILFFNSFPHFENKAAVVKKAYKLLKEGGELIIFHSLTRAELAKVHGGSKETKKDAVPTQSEFKEMFLKAGFAPTKIILEEGKDGCFFKATK
ncbi:MAG: methyltransferase domain-containing protein [Elusimicrobiota bacterium]|jgi:demethylmenaquinone methyltransferase/2-methoxy-6-polyprenyl-1,4-benzoquinol methylase|nr:methyltransferase domain-containing protein [Elusimicrobiota bacterium]